MKSTIKFGTAIIAFAKNYFDLSPASRALDFEDVIPGLRSLRLAHPGLNSVAAPRLVDNES